MFDHLGWIVEGKIKAGQQKAFEVVMNELVKATLDEEGTLNYQYYISEYGDVLVYERFKDIEAAHLHINTWEKFAERWMAAAEPTRMVHLGHLPSDLKARHAALQPLVLQPFSGFSR